MLGNHQNLRNNITQQRKALSTHAIKSASKATTEYLTSLVDFQKAISIACYLAINGELDTSYIIAAAEQSNKHVYLPILNGKSLLFAPYTKDTPLKKNQFGILEPDCNANMHKPASKIDLIVVPLVAFDSTCNRIGMGAGYYDRALANTQGQKPLKVGFAYDWQQTDSIQAQAWDVKMDMVMSDKKIYYPPAA